MKNLLLLFLVFLILFSNQNLFAQSQNNIIVVTDSNSFFFNGYFARVAFTVYNSSDTDIYFLHCAERYAFYIQKMTRGSRAGVSSDPSQGMLI